MLDLVASISDNNGFACKLTGAGGGGCAFVLLPPNTDVARILSLQDDLRSAGFETMECEVGKNGVELEY